MDYEGRIARLRSLMGARGVEALYVTNLTNVRYLCGFTGSAGSLLVGVDHAWFLTDSRYETQSQQEVSAAEVSIYRLSDQTAIAVGEASKKLGASRIGFEDSHVSVAHLKKLEDWFVGAELVGVSGLVEMLRRVKDSDEVRAIESAAEIGDAAFEFILGKVEVGRTEKEIALELEFFLQAQGAEALSFNAIVAAAERSALPHAHPTDRRIEKGRFLLFDFGCRYQGYCSDLTRTVIVGPADDRHREIYEIVSRSNAEGLAAVTPGKSGAEVDSAARAVIEEAGHGPAFGHGLGHGVGLEVHEEPTLRSTSTDVLEPGHIVTVEPGIYLPDLGGVRIEDLVLVTADGKRTLSRANKEFVVL